MKWFLGMMGLLVLAACGVTRVELQARPPVIHVAALAATVIEPPTPPPDPNTPVDLLQGPFTTSYAANGSVTVYASPNGAPLRTLVNPQANGLPLTFLAKSQPADGWMEVYLPTRPNGASGFVRVADLKLQQTNVHVQVEQARRRLTVWDGDNVVFNTPVAIGTDKWPTPIGTFYMQGIARLGNAGGPYGPFILALSAHSDVFMTFGGGDGLVGIHGTNQPGLIGSAVSHGCIRVNNDAIRHLADVVPVGAPVVIVS